MQKYKVDWLAFSVSFEDEEQTKSQGDFFTTRGQLIEIM